MKKTWDFSARIFVQFFDIKIFTDFRAGIPLRGWGDRIRKEFDKNNLTILCILGYLLRVYVPLRFGGVIILACDVVICNS